jgi:hypothetical protein
MPTERTTAPAAIVGLIGGALLVIGSFLTWVTVSLNVEAFAKILSDATGVQVNPSDLASVGLPDSHSTAGIKNDGKYTLVAGIVVVVCAVLLLALAKARMGAAILTILAGAAGALVAAFNLLTKDSQIDKALANVTPQLQGSGISVEAFRSILNVGWGIGIYLCLVGGFVALVAGVMALMSRTPTTAPPAAVGTGTGFETTSTAAMPGVGSSPSMPPGPPPPATDAPEPTQASEPPPPPGPQPGSGEPRVEPGPEPPA